MCSIDLFLNFVISSYDFFLIPQAVNQGTVTPVSFNVIYDDNKLPAEKLQLFTYKLTHGYYNWQGLLSVMFCCFYYLIICQELFVCQHRVSMRTSWHFSFHNRCMIWPKKNCVANCFSCDLVGFSYFVL